MQVTTNVCLSKKCSIRMLWVCSKSVFKEYCKKDLTVKMIYHICGLFGGDFNLAVWQIFIGSPNLNHAVLTRTHEMNQFISHFAKLK